MSRTFEAGPDDYAHLSIPVQLERGGRAKPAMVAIADALESSLPNAVITVVDGASHFLITSHTRQCAQVLGAFLENITGD